MGKIQLIDYVLNPNFIVHDNFLEEEQTSMKIELIKDNCQIIIFQLDKKLGREYKGGVFPFFNSQNRDITKVCDYIIFAEYKNNLYSLIIELKKGKSSTLPQINAGECFVDFVISTLNRVNNTNYIIHKRKISIREFNRKRNTKVKDIEYDENFHHFFKQNKFKVIAFLK
jgi:hypothetical protein